MTDQHPLVALETQGWEALTAGGEQATAFYDRVLAPDVVMLLPGGLRLTDRGTALGSMGGAPWASFEPHDAQVLGLGDDAALVHYAVRASRAGSPEYSALVSSTYVRGATGWLLTAHQQTPG